MPKVLVIGHDSRSFLATVRSLGRGGLEVHAAWARRDSAAFRSRYIRQTHLLGQWGAGGGKWLADLRALMQTERFDLVLPCDEAAFTIAHACREQLAPLGPVALLPPGIYDLLTDKLRTTALARQVGVPVPDERAASTVDAGAAAAEQFGYPVVLKPARSRDPASPMVRRVVRIVHDQPSLAAALPDMLSGGQVAVQRFLPGWGVGVEVLLDRGRCMLAFQHVRLHEPPAGGGSSYRLGVPIQPELLDAALRMLQPLGYTGVAMAEFRVDEQAGRWALLEVNPRLWGSLPLAVASGADFPMAMFRLLTGSSSGPASRAAAVRFGLYCRNWTRDLEWRVGRTPAPGPRRGPRAADDRPGCLLIRVLAGRERSDTLAADDPSPAVAEFAEIARRAWAKLSWPMTRCSPVRRLARRKMVRRLTRVGRVLFVCKGNICRSPFAEAYARAKGLPAEVRSAGYYPAPGRAVPAGGVAAAGRFGVDLAGHRSRLLDAELVRWADIIFVFDGENRARVLADFPFARDRVFLLSDIDPGGPARVDDPFGGGAEQFERTYRQIARLVDGLCLCAAEAADEQTK